MFIANCLVYSTSTEVLIQVRLPTLDWLQDSRPSSKATECFRNPTCEYGLAAKLTLDLLVEFTTTGFRAMQPVSCDFPLYLRVPEAEAVMRRARQHFACLATC